MPGCVALSDVHVAKLREYVSGGGRLVVVGPLGTHDEWMCPREKSALDDMGGDRIIRVREGDDWRAALSRTLGEPSLSINGVPAGGQDFLRAELTEQTGRRLLHLVNYQTDSQVKNVAVRIKVPKGRRAKSVTLASPEHEADIALNFTQGAGSVDFTVPSMGIYEIAVVAME